MKQLYVLCVIPGSYRDFLLWQSREVSESDGFKSCWYFYMPDIMYGNGPEAYYSNDKT